MVIKAILLSYDDVNMALYFHSSISALSNHSFSEEKIFIMKTCPCNEYPLKPHFYIVKLGCTHNQCFGQIY